ncbi:hypothetical protein EON80_16565 [bacterium]|nr:MAG: hypothetical protein EON80_16565 [bacterium]
MPVDKGSPANFCNPDTYTFGYLATLTSKGKDDETKDYQWWADWWAKNNEKLFWNKEKGVFEVQQ